MISKFKAFRIRITIFLGSYRGKSLFNLFYGLGASVAILGVLFKLVHLNGANLMLCVGLGTEVLIFALSALEPPFRNYHWEYVFPILKSNVNQDRPELQDLLGSVPQANIGQMPGGMVGGVPGANSGQVLGGMAGGAPGTPSDGQQAMNGTAAATMGAGGVVYVGGAPGGYSSEGGQQVKGKKYVPHTNPMADVTPEQAKENYGIPSQMPISDDDAKTLTESIKKMGEAVTQLNNLADITIVTEKYISKLSGMAENLDRFSDATGSLAEVSNVLLDSYKNVTENSDEISANSKGYVEQMGNLNHNLSGLNTIYEIQLKSISSQIDTIDRVNKGLVHIREMYEGSAGDSDRFSKETEAMAENLARLNTVYSRMLEAMAPNFVFGNIMAGGMAGRMPETPKTNVPEEPTTSDENVEKIS
jgi:hypothetical protein